MNILIKTVATLALLLPFAQAGAGNIPQCGNLPDYVREAIRNMAYCVTVEQPIAECGRAYINLEVFGNNENRLPAAGRGQVYYEGRAQRDPGGDAGAYRLVFLVTEGKSKSVIEQRYYSPNHYGGFCSF